ncbi:MAG: hypothetical protein PHH47_12985 [Gallionella sp.]|nr:hypothetical protein [Gallionella sp.]MDD4947603.1 hypothetical protein [Gallionella sp.]MDD5613008.1 hypothetical protein [Gallionella sp.]
MTKKNDAKSNLTTLSNLKVVDFDASSLLDISKDFARKITIDLSASIEARWDYAREQEERGKAHFAAMGLLLLSLNRDLAHGEFLPELERRGFDQRQAYRAMSYARYVFSQPKPQQMRLLEMPVTKVALLAQADPEVVEELMDGDDGEEKIESLSVRDLAVMVKNLKRNFDTVNNKKLALEDEVARLRPRTLTPGAAEFNARTFEVRHEAAALEYGARIHMDALDTLFVDVLEDVGVDAETESLRIKAVGLAAGAMLARALDLYERVKEGLGGEMPVKPHGDLMLSSDEKAMLQAGVMLLNANFERGREARKMVVDDEANKHRTGPGRRKGSKNKNGGES